MVSSAFTRAWNRPRLHYTGRLGRPRSTCCSCMIFCTRRVLPNDGINAIGAVSFITNTRVFLVNIPASALVKKLYPSVLTDKADTSHLIECIPYFLKPLLISRIVYDGFLHVLQVKQFAVFSFFSSSCISNCSVSREPLRPTTIILLMAV